jgi:hypothetical protein
LKTEKEIAIEFDEASIQALAPQVICEWKKFHKVQAELIVKPPSNQETD